MSTRLALADDLDAATRTRAHELGVGGDSGGGDPAPLLLARRDGKLAIAWRTRGAPGPVAVDFASWLARAPMQGLRRQLLARALGRSCRTAVDATAGLGRDALVLAACGCEVLAIEREPALFLLLEDGLRRAAVDPRTRDLAARITPRLGDAREVLRALAPDAVYLDPMFESAGGAQVKKELQALRLLLADDDGAAGHLLDVARAAARERVIVKRARKAPPLAAQPSFSVMGTRVRFDVYLRPA